MLEALFISLNKASVLGFVSYLIGAVLLFSVEEDAEGTVSLSTSLGMSLYTTDLSII